MSANENIKWIQHWLGEKVFPLWTENAVDDRSGSFVESLGRDLKPSAGARRALVQGRQLYTFVEGAKLGALPAETAKTIVRRAADALLKDYRQTNGAFVHSVDGDGKIDNGQFDLYAQGFALFGLGYAFATDPKDEYRAAALGLVRYLRRERAHAKGGFSETLGDRVHYQQNPHMHLFEAVITWGRFDQDPEWKRLAGEILTLFREFLVDARSGFLGEQFDADWKPQRENGRFYFEPGHQYEWSWLLAQAQHVFGFETRELSKKLFTLSEKYGIDAKTGLVYDEVWSDGKVKKTSSRFWPQSERIKAALVCGDGAAADAALIALKKFLPEAPAGVWEDTWLGSEFNAIPYKASSTYHIINALAEYVRLREKS